jgi:hypothetical protein
MIAMQSFKDVLNGTKHLQHCYSLANKYIYTVDALVLYTKTDPTFSIRSLAQVIVIYCSLKAQNYFAFTTLHPFFKEH